MKKRKYLLVTLLGMVNFLLTAQNDKQSAKEEPQKITSICPIDKTPAVFSTREELEAKVQGKKDRLILAIGQHAGDSIKVRQLKEQLWRFENGIVKQAK
jgi:hypothetical protein